MQHLDREESFDVGFLRHGTVDCAIFDVGQHVIIAVHRDNLDVLAPGLVHGNRSTFAAVPVSAANASNIRVRLNSLQIGCWRVRGISLVIDHIDNFDFRIFFGKDGFVPFNTLKNGWGRERAQNDLPFATDGLCQQLTADATCVEPVYAKERGSGTVRHIACQTCNRNTGFDGTVDAGSHRGFVPREDHDPCGAPHDEFVKHSRLCGGVEIQWTGERCLHPQKFTDVIQRIAVVNPKRYLGDDGQKNVFHAAALRERLAGQSRYTKGRSHASTRTSCEKITSVDFGHEDLLLNLVWLLGGHRVHAVSPVCFGSACPEQQPRRGRRRSRSFASRSTPLAWSSCC